MDDNFITIENVSKTYKNGNEKIRALESVSLRIRQGSFTCIVGGSGCGKTTLLNLLAGFEKPDSGHISIAGKLVDKPSYNRQVIFQNYGLLPWRTVAGNIAFALENVKGISKKEIQEKVHIYAELVGLSRFKEVYPHQLSGGMKQRVAVARALSVNPDVIFMDEPFGALDAITKMKLQDEILEICLREKKTIVMITHDIDEAAYLGDRILVMRSNPGHIFRDLPVSLLKPRHRNAPDYQHLRAGLLEALGLAVEVQEDYSI